MCFLCCQLFTDPKKCVPVLFTQTAFLIIFGKFNVFIHTDLYVNHSVKSQVFSYTGGRLRYWRKSRMGWFCFCSCICFQQPSKEQQLMMIVKMKAELERCHTIYKKNPLFVSVWEMMHFSSSSLLLLTLFVKLLGFRHELLGPEECFIRVIDMLLVMNAQSTMKVTSGWNASHTVSSETESLFHCSH